MRIIGGSLNGALSRGRMGPLGMGLGGGSGVRIAFREFDMTAGDGGQWIGYSVGTAPAPQPEFGSISNEPTSAAKLLAFYDDTASGNFIAMFEGDFEAQMQGLKLSIGGFVVDAFSVTMYQGATIARFNGIPGDLTVGGVYEVEFGYSFSSRWAVETSAGSMTINSMPRASMPSWQSGKGSITIIGGTQA